MINIEKKEQCCGCEACKDICTRNCISMEMDVEGFRYPIVDKTKCINCGLCNKVCHIANGFSRQSDRQAMFYAAYNKNLDEAREASSGGIFYELARYFIEDLHGVVYGAYCVLPYTVCHGRAETIEECKKFRKSKYLQSNMNSSYKNIKKDLQDGRKVLFSGTPCQVAGLYSFLQKPYDYALYTVEVICHGVPSETIYNKYIAYMEDRQGSKVIETCWRDKAKGWGPNHISFTFENGDYISTTSNNNDFQYAFLRNYILRPSCYSCHYAKLPRIADISLADYWGYTGELQKKNKNAGISAVIISSERGEKLWEAVRKSFVFHAVTEEDVKQHSRHVWTHPEKNHLRFLIFKDIEQKNFGDISKQVHGYKWYKIIRGVLLRMKIMKP